MSEEHEEGQDNQEGEEEEQEQFEFNEAIQPPPEVPTKTMEEEEDCLRVKLYRFDKEANEWKERGMGSYKILKHKEKQNQIRVLMRRDKIFKICANHFIVAGMKLTTNVSSDKIYCYATPADFSDEEIRAELLGVRFTTVEKAQEFKKKFEELVQSLEESKKEAKKE